MISIITNRRFTTCMTSFILMLSLVFLCGLNDLFGKAGQEVSYRCYSDIELDGSTAIGKIAEMDLRFGMVWNESFIRFWTDDSKMIHLKKNPAFNERIKDMAKSEEYAKIRFMITGNGIYITGQIISIE